MREVRYRPNTLSTTRLLLNVGISSLDQLSSRHDVVFRKIIRLSSRCLHHRIDVCKSDFLCCLSRSCLPLQPWWLVLCISKNVATFLLINLSTTHDSPLILLRDVALTCTRYLDSLDNFLHINFSFRLVNSVQKSIAAFKYFFL